MIRQAVYLVVCEMRFLKIDDSTLVADIAMQMTLSENGKTLEFQAAIRGILERKAAEAILNEQVYKDESTGLHSCIFYELAEHALSIVRRNKTILAMLYMGLDQFKLITLAMGAMLRTTAN